MARQKQKEDTIDRRNTGSPISPENTARFPPGGRSIQNSSNVRSMRELPDAFSHKEPLASRGSSGGPREEPQ